MSARTFAAVFGAVYTLVGILGFVPAFVAPPTDGPPMAVDAGYGYLLGLFPINLLHNAVHIAIGVLGLWAASTAGGPRFYARSLAVVFLLLALLGLVPGLNTTFGLIPLFGHDVWLHALTGLVAAYFGFVRSESMATRGAQVAMAR